MSSSWRVVAFAGKQKRTLEHELKLLFGKLIALSRNTPSRKNEGSSAQKTPSFLRAIGLAGRQKQTLEHDLKLLPGNSITPSRHSLLPKKRRKFSSEDVIVPAVVTFARTGGHVSRGKGRDFCSADAWA